MKHIPELIFIGCMLLYWIVTGKMDEDLEKVIENTKPPLV